MIVIEPGPKDGGLQAGVACLSLLAEHAGELPAETVPLLQQPGAFAQEFFPFGVSSLEPAQQLGIGGALDG